MLISFKKFKEYAPCTPFAILNIIQTLTPPFLKAGSAPVVNDLKINKQ